MDPAFEGFLGQYPCIPHMALGKGALNNIFVCPLAQKLVVIANGDGRLRFDLSGRLTSVALANRFCSCSTPAEWRIVYGRSINLNYLLCWIAIFGTMILFPHRGFHPLALSGAKLSSTVFPNCCSSFGEEILSPSYLVFWQSLARDRLLTGK